MRVLFSQGRTVCFCTYPVLSLLTVSFETNFVHSLLWVMQDFGPSPIELHLGFGSSYSDIRRFSTSFLGITSYD